MKTKETFKPEELSEVEQKILLLIRQRKRCRMSEAAATASVFCDLSQKELTAQIWRLVDLNYLTRLLDPRALKGNLPDHQVELSPKGLSACQQLHEKDKRRAHEIAKEAAAQRDQRAFEWKKTILTPLIETGIGAVAGMVMEHRFSLLSRLFQLLD